MLAATLLWLALAPDADIQGRVRAAPSGDAVPYATVRVAELRRTVSTDAEGNFVIHGVPDGRWRVQASAIGYHPTEAVVRVGGGSVVRLDFDLVAAPVALTPVEVHGTPRERSATPARVRGGPPPVQMGTRAVMAVPALVEADVLRAVQTLPSVAAASDFSSALYVRGGSPDQALVMLDGVPLFNPYHVGGLFGAIDPATVASVDVLAGAFPARTGDRLSGVVDIRTREGGRDAVRGSGAVSLISSRASLDGPLPSGRGSYLASIRRTYLDAFTDAAYAVNLIPGTVPYAFTDGHLKITHDVGTAGVATASVYVDAEGIDIPERLRRMFNTEMSFRWGSRLATAAYRHTFRPGLAGEARVGVSQFYGRFDAADEQYSGSPDTPPVFSPLLRARTETRNVLASAELARTSGGNQLRAGVQADAYRFAHDVQDVRSDAFGNFVDPFTRTDQPFTLAAYLDDEWAPSERLALRAGMRVLYAGELGTALMPRVGVRWSAAPGLALSAGGGRYAQVMHSLRDEESLGSAFLAYDLLAAPGAHAGLMTAEDVTVGAEWSRGATSLRVDAYARWLHDLPLPPAADNPLESPVLVGDGFRTGEGTARGLELLASHVRGRSHLSLSYALSFSERTVDGERFTPRFERRHTIDATAITPLGRSGEFNARLAIATGQPYTPVLGVAQGYRWDPATGRYGAADADAGTILLGRHNAARLPGYLRLDVSARREYRRRWFGQRMTLTPYLQVVNVLNTRNVLSAEPQLGGGAPTVLNYLPQIPVFPTFGVEWKF
ncbi:TonB-dependent receptor [Longimicrobium sp.]|jgi:hypothetical protein|uniref:TonB-dependent receptor n=1 Tax=Longimicrobium sp. TaxID=2029185 RepID=UPI002F95C660